MTTADDSDPIKDQMATATLQQLASGPPDTDVAHLLPMFKSQTAVQATHGVVVPENVAPPEPQEETVFSDATKDLVDLDTPQKPAKTVHLPPEDVQEERLHERREAEEEERRESEADKAARPSHLQTHNELASSPSSTSGPYSAATPMPPQDSPDTSPDSQSAQMDIAPPKDLRPTAEEQHAREEHDRLLEKQKEVARMQALGTETTPDNQLQWESCAAAAREKEERLARESRNGPEPDAKHAREETEADQVMDDVQADLTGQHSVAVVPDQANQSFELPPNAHVGRGDTDHITVTSRTKLPHPIDTSVQKPRDTKSVREPTETVADPPRLTTRMSSGASNRRSVGETPSRSVHDRRSSDVSPGAISPTTIPKPHGTTTEAPQTPRRPPRPVGFQSNSPPADSHFEDLMALRGAAEDPDRDYLEPLFRIQAHDSPSSRTKPLPELVKMANKYLSTADQFATLHERVDYRILRRIYQLQNANKWSLRQMEKCNEPEPVVTHWDHMMAEMKWMRKDFRAERKMKKSVCAWLAARCADWVAAAPAERKAMQVNVKAPLSAQDAQAEEQPPELEASGESAPEDEMMPSTPKAGFALPRNLVVVPELSDIVTSLQQAGTLSKALHNLPITGLPDLTSPAQARPLTSASKFVEGKILPKTSGPIRKRSRFDYEDDAVALEAEPESKRLREQRILVPEDEDVALFHSDNKQIRDRLHANNAFRPPSDFVMPSTSFYEWRNCSQWIWEDDQRLRKLAKEYSFNWSLIADEIALPSRYKSSAERRTPWECFERWVELETLPTEMRKTMYFKTWFQRLEQSQQAAERRYQAQVAAIQSQAQNGQPANVPVRKRTTPSRVEKRKNSRYLWLVDAMRKLARKRETSAYKQAEGKSKHQVICMAGTNMVVAQRAATQRKSQTDTTSQRPGPMLTPQEFSKRRYERDLQVAEAQRQHRQKLIEAQQRQLQMARAAQQGIPNGVPAPQRPGSSNVAQQQAQAQVNGQQNMNMNGQLPQQSRPALPMATRNGHLAVPQVNAQGIPQAPMRAPGAMAHPSDIQRLAQQNAQRSAQYGGQQPQLNGSMSSPGGGMTTQQQLQHNQQLLAQLNAQQQSNNAAYNHNITSNPAAHQSSASPSMPPPPTPQNPPQQLSSGHVPALIAIKSQLRSKHPHLSEEQLTTAATEALTQQSRNQSSNQARQNALNAAAGIPAQAHGNNMQGYAHNQAAYQNNHQLPNGNTAYMNGGDNTGPQQATMTNQTNTPQAAAAYANQLRQRQMAMMRMQQSPNSSAHTQVNGSSPGVTHASPNMGPASPSVQYPNNMAAGQMNGMNGGGSGGRPPSRSNTPQMQRLGSANGVPTGVGGMPGGMQSPGAPMPQGSPHNLQTNMAR